MKKINVYWLGTLLILVFSAFSMIPNQSWEIKDGYSIKFISKDPTGIFKSFYGDIDFDPASLSTSKFDLKIKVSSISTGNGMMNKKAQTAEWFDAGSHPEIKFVSSKIEKTDKGYNIIGALKMKGVTKTIKIPTTFKQDGSSASFSGTFYVKRGTYKIGSKSAAVPDILKIQFNVPVIKK